MSRSIFWKISIPIILVVIICMSILGYFLTGSVNQHLYQQLESSLTNQAFLVSNSIQSGFLESKDSAYFELAAEIIGKQINARVTIINADGAVLGDSLEDSSAMENHASRPEIQTALSGETGQSRRFSTTSGEYMLYIAFPVSFEREVLGVSRVSIPVTAIENYTGAIVRNIVFSLLAITILVIIATMLITRMITRPVRQVTRAAAKIAAGELDQKIDIRSSDELGRLGNAFNQMSLSLKNNLSAISDEQSKLVTVLKNITDGIIMTDNKTAVILTNTTARNLFNLKETDVIGKPLIEVLFNHEVDDLLKSCLNKNSTINTEIDLKNGKFLRVIAVPLQTTSIKGALLNFQDLTEMRNLQTMRKEFIGNISHELRTPLTSIKAIVETLQNGAINDRAAATEFLEKVNTEIDSMAQMISELIELTRIETGRIELNVKPLDMNNVITEIRDRLVPQATRKNISITADLLSGLSPVQADHERIQQVLNNIIYNAIKFTPSGGSIEVKSEQTENEIIVTITDTGIGISKSDIPHIFERFYKADKSRAEEGTGLGLAISKHIVLAHRGRIWVRSEEGQGSTFSFALPLK
ncbi:MAG TPA: HAMP domain-containing protein [Firmicutes bacterium]|nr:HAMP domain-containing protein [Bacillota bacterium]